jgi:hypothetical protein
MACDFAPPPMHPAVAHFLSQRLGRIFGAHAHCLGFGVQLLSCFRFRQPPYRLKIALVKSSFFIIFSRHAKTRELIHHPNMNLTRSRVSSVHCIALLILLLVFVTSAVIEREESEENATI